MISVREVTKKKPKSKGYYRGKMEKNQKQMQTGHSVKSRNGQQEEQCWSWEQCCRNQISQCSIFIHFFLFFPSGL